MAVKEYRPPHKGTLFCHWCGCTNHADILGKIRWHRIDGIMGDDSCWGRLKKFLKEIGVAKDETLMRDIVKELKRAKKYVALGALTDTFKLTRPATTTED